MCWWLCAFVLISLWALGAPPAAAQEAVSVAIDVRYDQADATAVVFVWGIDGWSVLPEAERPAGTVIKSKVMHTPMVAQGGLFTAQLRVPTDAIVNYGFLVTRAGTTFWDGDYEELARAGTVLSKLAVMPPVAPVQDGMATQDFTYKLKGVDDVWLVWALNGWDTPAPTLLPADSWVADGVAYTPMSRSKDTFATTLYVPPGTTINYFFQIARTDNKLGIALRDGRDAGTDGYQVSVSDGIPVEQEASETIRAELAIQQRPFTPDLRALALLLGVGAVGASSSLLLLPRLPGLVADERARLKIALAFVLLIAAVLRLNHIGQPFVDAFSWRQVSVAMMAENYYRQDPNILFPEVNWGGSGPNYQGREFQTVSYTAALLYNLFGQHDWVGRGVALVFGVWGVFALYKFTERVWDAPRALASAAALAIMPGAVLVDRSFLPDPAMVALVVTTAWMFVSYLQTDQPRYLALASLIGAWGFCTKIPGLIVGLALAYATLAVFGLRKTVRRPHLIHLALFALATLIPVAAYYMWARHLALSYPPFHFAGGGNWVWDDGLDNWLGQSYFLPKLWTLYLDWMWCWPLIGLVLLGLLVPLPRAHGRPRWMFHFWLLGGVIFFAIGAKEMVSNPWNFHILNPAAAALAGHALVSVATFVSRPLRRPLAPLIISATLLLAGFVGYRSAQVFYRSYAHEGYALGTALHTFVQPGDLAITLGTDFGDPVPLYYAGVRGWGFPPPDNAYAWDRMPDSEAMAIRLFDELRAKKARWFGLVSQHYPDVRRSHPRFMSHVEQYGELVYSGAGGVIFRIVPPATAGTQP